MYTQGEVLMFETTKKFCDSFLELGTSGFDLVIYKDGECVLRHMNGYSDLENKVKMNGHERYNIYSWLFIWVYFFKFIYKQRDTEIARQFTFNIIVFV